MEKSYQISVYTYNISKPMRRHSVIRKLMIVFILVEVLLLQYLEDGGPLVHGGSLA